MPKPRSQSAEAVVIGSGAGGLTAAVALANAGRQVLVLEQHHRPGGWCHSFERNGFSFSPGVHYLGELGEEGLFREMLKGLGVSGDLELCQINPEGYDHLLVQDQRVDVPEGRDGYMQLLQERFPRHRRGLKKYFRRMFKVGDEFMKADQYLKGWKILQLPFRVPNFLLFGNRLLTPFLRSITDDPWLQTFLAAQAGIYALPPSQTPLLLHSLLTYHYGDGAFYPRGGAQRIPEAFIAQLRRRGGEIRLSSPVQRIIVEGGRAAGVVLADGETIAAQHVIANGDPQMTLARLVGHEHLSEKTRRRLQGLSYSSSCLSLFIATDLDLREMGYDSGNYWYYSRPDIEGIYSRSSMEIPDPFESFFLSIPTLKDPSLRSDGAHTIEVIAIVPYGPFSRWKDQPCNHRDREYHDLKEQLTQRLLRAIEQIIPDLGSHLLYQELGTPLTNHHFCWCHEGAMYGTAKVRGQFGAKALPVQTEIQGLLMVGASTFCHGVMGASVSGLMAASAILDRSFEDLLKEEGPDPMIYPSEDPKSWLDRLPEERVERAIHRSPSQTHPIQPRP